jgi:hypothetical protein
LIVSKFHQQIRTYAIFNPPAWPRWLAPARSC